MSLITDYSINHLKDIDLLSDETSKTSNQEQKEIKEKKKKKVFKRKNKYEELLKDTFLFHIGEKKERNIISNSNEEPSKKTNKKRSLNKNDNSNNKKNDKKNLKQSTMIFHGENYEKTKSPLNFMKYNFNYIKKENHKLNKLIENKEQQHINLPLFHLLNMKINDLYNIPKNIWNPSLYKNNIPLKDILSKIEKIWPKHIYCFREDFALNIIKDKNYKIDNICDFIKSKDFILYLQKLKKKNLKNDLI